MADEVMIARLDTLISLYQLQNGNLERILVALNVLIGIAVFALIMEVFYHD